MTTQLKNKAARKRHRAKSGHAKYELIPIKTCKHFYAQLVEKETGHTITSYSTFSKDISSEKDFKTYNISGATLVGKKLAAFCEKLNIEKKEVYLNRSSYIFHGKIAAFYSAFLES